jgi:hypothetical protein
MPNVEYNESRKEKAMQYKWYGVWWTPAKCRRQRYFSFQAESLDKVLDRVRMLPRSKTHPTVEIAIL